VQNFTPVGPRISEISRGKKIKNKKTSGLKLKFAPQAIASGWTNYQKLHKNETIAYQY